MMRRSGVGPWYRRALGLVYFFFRKRRLKEGRAMNQGAHEKLDQRPVSRI